MKTPLARSPRFWVAIHALCWAVAIGCAAVLAPGLQRLALDYGVPLPPVARSALGTARVAEGAAVPLALMLAAFLAVEYAVLRSWKDDPRPFAAARWWLVALAVVPLVIVAWGAFVALRVWVAVNGRAGA